jgi:hypothetical protein
MTFSREDTNNPDNLIGGHLDPPRWKRAHSHKLADRACVRAMRHTVPGCGFGFQEDWAIRVRTKASPSSDPTSLDTIEVGVVKIESIYQTAQHWPRHATHHDTPLPTMY